jgi:hypothetical protein
MTNQSLGSQLSQLEQFRNAFAPGDDHRLLRLLKQLGRARFSTTAFLMRFHEALLFFRAFPSSPAILRETEKLLRGFLPKVEHLQNAGGDLDDFDTFEDSGMVGTIMQDTLSFDVLRWLVQYAPRSVEIAWDDYEDERGMGMVWPLLMPLQAEDAYVEANIPWRKWLEKAVPRGKTELQWIIEQIEQLPMSNLEKSRTYDLLRLPVRWKMGNQHFSRTLNWSRPQQVFYHREPLLQRSVVSLREQLSQKPPRLRKLSRAEGRQAIYRIHEIMLVRYRELYGTTLGDPDSVLRVDLGRGVEIYLWNLPPDRRLPLRAYVAGFTLKNGVPINYIEAIGLCEWMEVGFNTFYTFRGGEVAWIFAQVLRCLCSLTGATCISMYPYQLGDHNEEAIESGAYWFYRKLGLRPSRKDLVALVEQEERKIAGNPMYRTSARTLRRLASASLIYELPGSEIGAWDHFSTRNLGLMSARRMSRDFEGEFSRFRESASAALAKLLNVERTRWSPLERQAFEDFAVVLFQAKELRSWTPQQRRDLAELIRAKSAPDEMLYLHLTQKHTRLRELLLKLGS